MNNSTFDGSSSKFASATRSDDVEIHLQSKEIEKSLELCSVLNSMPDLILILNRNRQIVFGNTAIAEFAKNEKCDFFNGLRPGELVSCQHALSAESGCGTGETCKSCGAVLSILSALDGKNSINECRISRITASGISSLDLKIWAKPFMFNGENFCMVILSDICNEKRRRVLERIFFHDVMNTAGNISNIAEMLNQDLLPVEEMIDLLKLSARQLLEEIKSQKQLLDAESNDLQLSISPIRSLSILGKLASSYTAHEMACGKKILIDGKAEDFLFESDETLLSRIIGNLVKNALEASVEGETVTLDCGKDSTSYHFSCHNDSVMPENIRLQIFQRSFSTKGAGRGIGTYSVKLLTEKYLGGNVSLSSEPGKGTVFSLKFPLSASMHALIP